MQPRCAHRGAASCTGSRWVRAALTAAQSSPVKTRVCTGAVHAPVGATGTQLLLGDRHVVVPCISVSNRIQQSTSSKVQKLLSDFLKRCIESAESTGREISSLFAANFEFKEASGNSWFPCVALPFLWVLFIAGELN